MSKKNKKGLHVDAHGNIISPEEQTEQIKPSKKLEAKTEGQQRYIDTIRSNIITLAEGTFGVGKTHISVGVGLEYLQNGLVKKLIISRPSVSACGLEDGFYPGSAQDKLKNYLLGIMEEIKCFISDREMKRMIANETIVLMPVSLMRGQNFIDSFVIIDECENLTFRQIELILTRVSKNCTLCMSGDFAQSDLPIYQRGAFRAFFQILTNIPQIGLAHLGQEDIVRSPMLKTIINRICDYRGKQEEIQEIKEKFVKY